MSNTKKRRLLPFFKEIWDERPHISEVSGRTLPAFHPILFSHIISKGAAPSLKFRKDNIMLMTSDEHCLWEHSKEQIKDIPMWKPVYEKYMELKREVNQPFKPLYDGL